MKHLPLFNRWNFQKITALLILVATLVAGTLFFMDNLIGPLDEENSVAIQVAIPPGSGVAKIGNLLEQSGVIRKATYFTAVTRLLGVDGKMKAGYYEFNTGMSIKEIIAKLIKGEIATFKVTIPEGLSVREMAPLVEKRTGIPADEFIQAVANYKPDFMTEHDVEFPVEGFLFPDTYQLPYGVTAEQLVKTMVNRFIKIIGTEPVMVRGRTLSMWEVVTIASLIEEEAKLSVDRPLISGVIYNRLEKRMNLQLCASVLYVLGVKKERITFAETRVESPYNTYQNPGLPPGPISNPGLESIKAAMNPSDEEYLFYIATSDGTTYYTKTYKEHLVAIKKYLE